MQSAFSVTVIESSAKCLEMLNSYLEKSGNFILPNLWEPCFILQCFAARIVYAVRYEWIWLFLCQMLPSVLWHCWLGVRKNIRPVKHWVMRCWRGYLPGARCKWFACGPANATTTASSLASLKSRLVEPFWCRLTEVVLEKKTVKWASSYMELVILKFESWQGRSLVVFKVICDHR